MTPTQKLILLDLSFGPATARDLQDEVGICLRQLTRSLKKLREMKLVHIISWERGTSGPHKAVWAEGEGKDARRLPNLTGTQKTRRWRQSHREQYNAYKRELHRKKRASLGLTPGQRRRAASCLTSMATS